MTGLGSWALGTAGLWVVLAVSIFVSGARPFPALSPSERRELVLLGLGSCVVQGAHFAEEILTGFPSVFPRMLGLIPWSPSVFTAFNLLWFVIWVISVREAPRGRRIAEWPLWFLALALVANGIAHPALALRAGGYFPGLGTSLVAGGAGVLLLRCLLRLTHSTAIAAA